MKTVCLQILFSLCMFIANENTENPRKSGSFGDTDVKNRDGAGNTEVQTPTEGRSNTSTKNAKSKRRRNQPPKWPKYPFYNQEQLGEDYFESKPKRRHTRTIVFQPGFNRDGQSIARFYRRFKKHARVVAPSSPLRTRKELKHWLKWFHTKKKYGQFHSWTLPKDNRKALGESVMRIWDQIHKEAALLNGNYKKIYLVGHGQGASLAIQAGKSFNKSLGGIVALKNWTYGRPHLGMHQANAETPILTILGANDRAVKLKDAISRMKSPFWKKSKKHIKLRVQKHQGHGMNHRIFRITNRWIRRKAKWYRKNN